MSQRKISVRLKVSKWTRKGDSFCPDIKNVFEQNFKADSTMSGIFSRYKKKGR